MAHPRLAPSVPLYQVGRGGLGLCEEEDRLESGGEGMGQMKGWTTLAITVSPTHCLDSAVSDSGSLARRQGVGLIKRQPWHNPRHTTRQLPACARTGVQLSAARTGAMPRTPAAGGPVLDGIEQPTCHAQYLLPQTCWGCRRQQCAARVRHAAGSTWFGTTTSFCRPPAATTSSGWPPSRQAMRLMSLGLNSEAKLQGSRVWVCGASAVPEGLLVIAVHRLFQEGY